VDEDEDEVELWGFDPRPFFTQWRVAVARRNVVQFGRLTKEHFDR